MNSAEKITKTQEMVYELKVGDVMTRNVITVRPEDHMSDLRDLLRVNRIAGVPVVEGDQLVGLISIEDFIKWLADRQQNCEIRERMTDVLETLCDDDPLVLAFGKFDRFGLGRFPVVDRKTKKLVGIVTKGDVIEGLLRKLEIDYQEEQLQRDRAHQVFEDIEADDTILVFQYDVKGQDFNKAGMGSSRLKRTLKRLGIRPDIVRRVAIASYEAEMNLVVFTQGGRIWARVKPNRILVEIEDDGPGIEDVDKALQPGYSTAPDWVRELGFGAGMGLPNIRKSSDRFHIRSELGRGTLLKVSFFIDEDEHETGRSGEQTRTGREVGFRTTRQQGHRRIHQRSAQRRDRTRQRRRHLDHPSGASQHRCRRQHEKSRWDYPGQRTTAGTRHHRESGNRRNPGHGQPAPSVRIGGTIV